MRIAGLEQWRRVALLFAVLFGVFLMHGMSAGGDGCHAHAVSSPADGSMGASTAQPVDSPISSTPQVTADGVAHSRADESCTPFRSDTSADLLAAIAFLAITAWMTPRTNRPVAPTPGPRHGPPRPAGAELLLSLSVSRT